MTANGLNRSGSASCRSPYTRKGIAMKKQRRKAKRARRAKRSRSTRRAGRKETLPKILARQAIHIFDNEDQVFNYISSLSVQLGRPMVIIGLSDHGTVRVVEDRLNAVPQDWLESIDAAIHALPDLSRPEDLRMLGRFPDIDHLLSIICQRIRGYLVADSRAPIKDLAEQIVAIGFNFILFEFPNIPNAEGSATGLVLWGFKEEHNFQAPEDGTPRLSIQ